MGASCRVANDDRPQDPRLPLEQFDRLRTPDTRWTAVSAGHRYTIWAMPAQAKLAEEVAAESQLSISWRNVALAAVAFGIVAVAALVVVASLRHTETLATVALSLAVLAFLVQIIIFLGQTSTQTAQVTRSEDIYGRTLELLADIRESSRHTQEAVKEQREFLLPALLAKLDLQRPPADAAPVDYTRAADDAEAFYPPRERSPDDGRIARALSTWPTDPEIARQAAAELAELSSNAVEFLVRFAQDEWFVRSRGATISNGLYLDRDVSWTQELLQHGLIRPLDPPLIDARDPGREFLVLSDKGREQGRLLIAPLPKPPMLHDIEFPRPELTGIVMPGSESEASGN